MNWIISLLRGNPRWIHQCVEAWQCHSMMWVGIGSAVVSAGTSIYGSTQANKAAQKNLDAQKAIQANLKYEPIDIEALKKSAMESAVQNATASLAMERSLTPVVADTREQVDRTKLELAKQVDADLRMGGNLSPDVINRVNTAGRVIGSSSGIGSGSTVPLTASLLGLTSMDLINKRRADAAALQGPGELPTAGLDPGQVAGLEVAQNAAMNDFNVAKAGGDSSLASSEAAARSAQIGGQVGMVSSLAGLAGTVAGGYKSPSTNTPKKATTGGLGMGLLDTYKPLATASVFRGP